ncbi:tetratricopeptide repeat protein [Ichthyenterobacterium magnum]|uniref:Tetratricopeptide repeat protein n=1 Tax=Ichthyenterobacterium magnum TaxID=1230530 RepID=A0A420DKL4_9FLAO|nr:cell surface protein [Ichthyenterobacterium magnum]RKE94794.1 tetratricopeptide repeat protein [Ichthyenterobacterium magnum]
MKLRYILPLIISAFMFSCNSNKVTKTEDYKAYLTTTIDHSELMANANLWTEKLEKAPNQFPYLSKRVNAYTQIFNTTGNIDFLIKAEKDLNSAIEMTNRKFPAFLKSLAANYISQHRFKEALVLLKEADASGEKRNGTKKMFFDVHLELGNYLAAEAYLKQIKNTSDFDYLIRLAKWEDHKGNLEGAIKQMEKATAIAEASNLKGIKQWSYTNLADFYGHAGEIKKSYNHYLKALKLDPNDAYAKKGIAWITYSYENNTNEALNILNHISTYYKAPDYDLLKAEIAEYTNDKELKSSALNDYKSAVQNKQYGDMYNAYNVMVYNDELLLPEQALEIAKHEVESRPTPQSYDLLAWSYFKKGDVEKANAIVEKFIEGQTYEPTVLYHIAEIYKAAGKTDKVKELKSELVASLYELGPTMVPKIKQL